MADVSDIEDGFALKRQRREENTHGINVRFRRFLESISSLVSSFSIQQANGPFPITSKSQARSSLPCLFSRGVRFTRRPFTSTSIWALVDIMTGWSSLPSEPKAPVQWRMCRGRRTGSRRLSRAPKVRGLKIGQAIQCPASRTVALTLACRAGWHFPLKPFL